MDSTLSTRRRRPQTAFLRIFRRSGGGDSSPAAWPALMNGLFGAAAFAGVLMFIAKAIDSPMAKIASGLDPTAAILLETFSELGSSGWMLVASALAGVAALVLAANAHRPRTQAGYAVLATRAGFLFLTVALSVVLAQAVKFALGRAHPHLIQQFDAFHFQLFTSEAATASFPSGHATTAFAAATVMALFVPRWQIGFFMLALAIAVARVATGLHFPSDVLGGMVLGMALAFSLARYFARRKLVFHLVDNRLVRRGERLVRRAVRATATHTDIRERASP